MRRLLALALFVGGPLLYLARRRQDRERVHLYYDDGSMVALEHGTPAAERLLSAARTVL